MNINNEQRKERQRNIFNTPSPHVMLYSSMQRRLFAMERNEAINHAQSILRQPSVDGTSTISQKAAKDWLEIFSGVNKD